MKNLPMRILLADDHDVVRRGLRQLLEDHQGWTVCGEATTGRQAVEMAKELMPHLVILDLTMPELNGLEATRQIRKELPLTQVLVFTMHESEQLVREVLAAGAKGYVLKSDAARLIISAVEALAQGKPYFNLNVSATLLAAFLRGMENEKHGMTDPLTGREREIAQLLAERKEQQTDRDVARHQLENGRFASSRDHAQAGCALRSRHCPVCRPQ